MIAEYVGAAGYRGVVCFSCGNASAALIAAGLDVVDVSPRGAIEARRWWQPEEIARVWPDRFDATSGHLTMPLMVRFAGALAADLGPLDAGPYTVPTGSGETITALRFAYPGTAFVAEYGNDAATRYEAEAPLTAIVAALGPVVGLVA